jgi:multidrug efflux system membrane fusion protein
VKTCRTWILCAGLLGVLAGCHQEQPYQKPLTPVAVRPVVEYRGESGARYSGNIGPNTQVNVAFKAGGYVEEILQVGGRIVQEGDAVRKGDLLARVRQTDYQAKVREAQSNLSSAAAALEQAKFAVQEAQPGLTKAQQDFGRAQNLFRSQSLTKPDFDAATAQRDASQARLDAARAQQQLAETRIQTARAQLEEAQIALGDTDLRSPMDGLVMKRSIEIGSLVGPGSGAFVLADTSSVKVVFGAPDMLLPSLRVGMPLSVSTESINGVEFGGHITNISPSADTKSRVFDVEITIPNPRGVLKPGMIAALQAGGQKPRQAVPAVPLTAVVRSKNDPSAYGVYVVERQGGNLIPHARNVVLGEAFGNLIAVSQGVKPGEQVVVSGATLVKDGEPVQVIPE